MKAYLIALYGILVVAGGVIGYILKQSWASLAMGGIFGALLLYLAYGVSRKCRWSYDLSIGTVIFLTLFFGYRYATTFSIVPSGVFAIVSAAVALILIVNREKPL